jgi:hypothetical protein
MKADDLKIVKIDSGFSLFENRFKLVAVIYFQDMHYTCHVNGIYQKKLIPKINKWFYYDGKLTDSIAKIPGMLTPGDPSLHINMTTTRLRPYILIYRVVDS